MYTYIYKIFVTIWNLRKKTTNPYRVKKKTKKASFFLKNNDQEL